MQLNKHVGVSIPKPQQRLIRVVSALGYLIFFLPLLFYPRSPFARHHANQGLILLISLFSGWILGVVTYTLYIGYVVLPLVMAGGAFMVIYGGINALCGRAKLLPFIGFARLIDPYPQ